MLIPGDCPDYLEVQQNFKTYKNIIIKRSIMIAKRDYYNKIFIKYSKNLKMTWKAINDTLNRHKTSEKDEVAQQPNCHFTEYFKQ